MIFVDMDGKEGTWMMLDDNCQNEGCELYGRPHNHLLCSILPVPEHAEELRILFPEMCDLVNTASATWGNEPHEK